MASLKSAVESKVGREKGEEVTRALEQKFDLQRRALQAELEVARQKAQVCPGGRRIMPRPRASRTYAKQRDIERPPALRLPQPDAD